VAAVVVVPPVPEVVPVLGLAVVPPLPLALSVAAEVEVDPALVLALALVETVTEVVPDPVVSSPPSSPPHADVTSNVAPKIVVRPIFIPHPMVPGARGFRGSPVNAAHCGVRRREERTLGEPAARLGGSWG
jgi:hypothetical protein